MDAINCEQVIEKMDGMPFNGGQMIIGYGIIGPKPKYNRNAPKGPDQFFKFKFLFKSWTIHGSLIKHVCK